MKLFDKETGRWQRDEAMARGAKGAAEPAKIAALWATVRCAQRFLEFTSDEVFEEIQRHHLPQFHDGRVMGTIMREAAKHGYIERTDRTRTSRQASNHARPVRVWRSLIYGGPV